MMSKIKMTKLLSIIVIGFPLTLLQGCMSYYEGRIKESFKDPMLNLTMAKAMNDSFMVAFELSSKCGLNELDWIQEAFDAFPSLKNQPTEGTNIRRIDWCLLRNLDGGISTLETAEYLIKNGANVNARYSTDDTSLPPMGNLLRGFKQTIKHNKENPENAYANPTSADEVIAISSLLLSKGARINFESATGVTYADFADNQKILKFLMDKGLDVTKHKQGLIREAKEIKAAISFIQSQAS